MLGDVLDSHPEISCKNEILNHLKDFEIKDKVNYLSSYFSANPNDKKEEKKQIIGGTINPFKYQLEPHNLYQFIYPVCQTKIEFWLKKNLFKINPHLKIIVLLRKNVLKQSVSFYLAQERNKQEWESSLHLIQNRDALRKKEFDLDKLQNIVLQLCQKSTKLTQFAYSLTNDPLMIFYEDFLQVSQEVFNRIFAYVGASPVENSFDFTAGYQKILSEDLRDIIANYQELYQYTAFIPYLEN